MIPKPKRVALLFPALHSLPLQQKKQQQKQRCKHPKIPSKDDIHPILTAIDTMGYDGTSLRRPYLAWPRNLKRCAVPLWGRDSEEKMGREKVTPRFISRNDSTQTMIVKMVVGRRIVIIVRLIVVLTDYGLNGLDFRSRIGDYGTWLGPKKMGTTQTIIHIYIYRYLYSYMYIYIYWTYFVEISWINHLCNVLYIWIFFDLFLQVGRWSWWKQAGWESDQMRCGERGCTKKEKALIKMLTQRLVNESRNTHTHTCIYIYIFIHIYIYAYIHIYIYTERDMYISTCMVVFCTTCPGLCMIVGRKLEP